MEVLTSPAPLSPLKAESGEGDCLPKPSESAPPPATETETQKEVLAETDRLDALYQEDPLMQTQYRVLSDIKHMHQTNRQHQLIIFTAPHGIALNRDHHPVHSRESYTTFLARSLAEMGRHACVTWNEELSSRDVPSGTPAAPYLIDPNYVSADLAPSTPFNKRLQQHAATVISRGGTTLKCLHVDLHGCKDDHGADLICGLGDNATDPRCLRMRKTFIAEITERWKRFDLEREREREREREKGKAFRSGSRRRSSSSGLKDPSLHPADHLQHSPPVMGGNFRGGVTVSGGLSSSSTSSSSSSSSSSNPAITTFSFTHNIRSPKMQHPMHTSLPFEAAPAEFVKGIARFVGRWAPESGRLTLIQQSNRIRIPLPVSHSSRKGKDEGEVQGGHNLTASQQPVSVFVSMQLELSARLRRALFEDEKLRRDLLLSLQTAWSSYLDAPVARC
uniref:N-formylglutamate amidohydrolase n=2 Tax=Chromera velia CCMP2878 TaxID=1169474 RepID=A0A0K6S7S9_9ALVE|mmetsp:Transcript_12569/g.24458  ORF Transcript_12569/g.24458 Transcript_12569/m.24458 type:complete len:448 (-) Transcript_12569:200-1543(-)|eukprot:Cvel_21596.t1-p1 / transcript=Cvel_21596.t1 / gene=Cvel_21596 / organism=Chromera_velia_CCMP2878 / gene_product=hypothetical protein / transcript_product=hypothetical protein / location=Cvel_scaffold2039:12458-15024(-) / protein_length=447 / sequence_SO=supercontig / SO=protein_coding / is_pseudo=false